MSKILKRTRNITVIALLTFSLVLLSSIAATGQTSSADLPQIQGVTKMIEGRELTIPKLNNFSLNILNQNLRVHETNLRQVPELKKAQFLKLDTSKLSQLTIPSFLAVADNFWSKAEYTDANIPEYQYVSGSVTCAGRNVPVAPAAGQALSYLELSDYMGNSGSNYGKRWMSGEQLVDGGCGILKAVNNGQEPTGRLVWGIDTFKIVLDSVNEHTDRAEFSAYMRICTNLPIGGKTCTPYFIKLPWFPVTGNNWVAIGAGIP